MPTRKLKKYDLERVVRDKDGIELSRAAELLGFGKNAVRRHAMKSPHILYHSGCGEGRPSRLFWKHNLEGQYGDLKSKNPVKTTYTDLHML